MKIDFSVITIYELIALILSAGTILFNVLRYMYTKYIVKPQIEYHSVGSLSLYSNLSGSYIKLNGVIDVLNKSVFVKKIRAKVIRSNDDKCINLEWSTFMSPVSQRITGSYMSSQEEAHPFRVWPGTTECAFIEYVDPYNASATEIETHIEPLKKTLNELLEKGLSYNEAYEAFVETTEYKDAKLSLEREMFWRVGHYTIELVIEYDNCKKAYPFSFDVTEGLYKDIKHNINECLISYLKDAYRVPYNYKTTMVKLSGRD